MPPGEPAEAVPRRWRTSLHRLIAQVALDIGRKTNCRFVAAVAVLLERLHDNPVQLAAAKLYQSPGVTLAVGGDPGGGRSQRADARTWPGRLFLPDYAKDLLVRGRPQSLFWGQRRASQELVQQRAQGVDIH